MHEGVRAAVVVTAFMLIVTAGCTDGGGSTGGVAADGELMVHSLDGWVRQDSTLLVSGDEAMLIDTGNRDDAGYILSYLDELGIDELEYIVFTHPHDGSHGIGE